MPIVAGTGTGCGSGSPSSADAAPTATPAPGPSPAAVASDRLLFVLGATRGEVLPSPEGAPRTLRFDGVDPSLLAFADRPIRIAVTQPTSSLFAAWPRTAFSMDEHFKLAMMFLFSPRVFREQQDGIKALEAGFAAAPPDPVGYRRQLEYCRDHDTRDRLDTVMAPTLVVNGAEDLLCTPFQGRDLSPGDSRRALSRGSRGGASLHAGGAHGFRRSCA